MSTSSDINTLRTGGAGAATAEQAQRAVKAFRALQPTLTAYARNLTGRNDVRVEMAAQDNGSTDGKRIFFRPPIALGADTKHQRSVCGRRDRGTLLHLCAACDAREDVLVTIYHEIAHIAFETFVDVDDAEAADVAAKAAEAAGGAWAKHVAERIRKAPTYMKRNYMAVSNLASPFMPLLWNALEDARVNAEMFSARPGTKVMFDSNTKKIFREGVEQVDRATGEIIVKKWDEYPANMQVLVGLFCKASGYDYRGWFAPQIERALDDAELNQLLQRMPTIRSTRGIYNLCFPLLTRLRQLGFCKTDDEPEEEPDEAQPEDPSVEEEPPPSPPEGEDEKPEGEDATDDPDTDSEDEGDGGQDAPDESDVRSGDADSEGEPEEESADASEDPADGGTDSEESGSEGDPGEGDEPGGDSDPEAAAGQPDAGDAESGEGDGDSDPADGAGEGDPESADEGGAESDSGRPDLGSDEEGPVDESELGDDSDPSGRGGSDESDEESDDASSDEDAGITGTGDAGDDQAVGEGTGGKLDADAGSGGEDHASGDADSLGEPGGSDMAPAGESDEGSDEPGGDAGRDADGSDDDESAEAGRDASADDDTDSGDVPDGSAGEEARPGGGDDEEAEPWDTGADSGQGGTELIEDSSLDDKPIEMGTAEDAQAGLLKFGDHEDKPKTMEEKAAEKAVDTAIIQGLYFETPSRNITGVREHRWGVPQIIGGFNFSQAWDDDGFYSIMSRRSGRDADMTIAESVLGPALMRMRVAFADNQRGHNKQHLKSGKVNGRVLGKRAHLGDPRLFRKKVQPGKKNYLVVIGMDVSGSTSGVNIVLEKQAVMAQAELCRRMGIPFAIYAHSGNYWSPTDGRASGFALDVYIIKEEHEAWDKNTQERLTKLGPDSANLDGHFLEYLRKRADESQATDTVILYYSDGKMPAENHDEELEILQREIKTCDQKGYTLLGVGIRTDSPARHGLDTVQVDSAEDVGKVVKHLEKRLMAASAR